MSSPSFSSKLRWR